MAGHSFYVSTPHETKRSFGTGCSHSHPFLTTDSSGIRCLMNTLRPIRSVRRELEWRNSSFGPNHGQ
eukprot:484058-Amphidinium_carterae.1